MEKVVSFLNRIFFTNISEMNMFDIILTILISTAILYFTYRIMKCIVNGFDTIKKISYNTTHYSRVKCSRIQCPSCGRTLDRCICALNSGKSYRRRLRNYNKTRKG